MKEQVVLFILDEGFEGDLHVLSRTQHVWICESEANMPLIEAVWERGREECSQQRGVTSFRRSGSRLDTFYSFLSTIDEHHSGDGIHLAPWSQLTVLGVQASEVETEKIKAELRCECRVSAGEDSELIIKRLENERSE